MRKSIKSIITAAFAMLSISLPAMAQTADDAVHLIVPYAAGGNVDVTARFLANTLTEILDRPVIVENKPGAGGMIGGRYVADAAPDGDTLFVSSNAPLVTSPLIFSNPLYTWDEAFEPVANLTIAPTVLLARPDLEADDLAGFLALAQAKRLTLSTGGAGSVNHLASELLQIDGKVKWRQIHYGGSVEGLADVMGGHVDAAITQITDAEPYFRDGKLKPLAVLGARRLGVIEGVATAREAGYSRVDAPAFVGVAAPKGTPDEIVGKLSDAIGKAMADESVVESLRSRGSIPEFMDSAAFRSFLEEQQATWQDVVDAAGVRAP